MVGFIIGIIAAIIIWQGFLRTKIENREEFDGYLYGVIASIFCSALFAGTLQYAAWKRAKALYKDSTKKKDKEYLAYTKDQILHKFAYGWLTMVGIAFVIGLIVTGASA